MEGLRKTALIKCSTTLRSTTLVLLRNKEFSGGGEEIIEPSNSYSTQAFFHVQDLIACMVDHQMFLACLVHDCVAYCCLAKGKQTKTAQVLDD